MLGSVVDKHRREYNSLCIYPPQQAMLGSKAEEGDLSAIKKSSNSFQKQEENCIFLGTFPLLVALILLLHAITWKMKATSHSSRFAVVSQKFFTASEQNYLRKKIHLTPTISI